MESLDTLAFELDLLFDILVYEADMPCKLGNENRMIFKVDFEYNAPSESQSSLPSASNTPNIEALSPIGTDLKPRPPPSPNIVIFSTTRPSKTTRGLQISSQVSRKSSNFDRVISTPSSFINTTKAACNDNCLPQKHLLKKQFLPPESYCHTHTIYHLWGVTKVYTAHIGWENGESSVIKFLDDNYKLPP